MFKIHYEPRGYWSPMNALFDACKFKYGGIDLFLNAFSSKFATLGDISILLDTLFVQRVQKGGIIYQMTKPK